MANVKISDLTTDTSPVDGSAIEVASLTGTAYTSKKMLLSALASYVISKIATPSPIAPTLQGAWVSFGSGYAPARYYRGVGQRVTIEGLIKSGADGLIFNLPAGYRPSADLLFLSYKNGGSVAISVKANGDVSLTNSSPDFSSLSGVSFYATQ